MTTAGVVPPDALADVPVSWCWMASKFGSGLAPGCPGFATGVALGLVSRGSIERSFGDRRPLLLPREFGEKILVKR